MKKSSKVPSAQPQPGSSQRTQVITRVALTAIALVGASVIIGWHFHVRLLVQILPGVIPMQYNTALCFIVMGMSGLLLVTRRGPWILPAVGGLVLAVMGGLVIYQYSTGISLGVDTLLFYPWDLTLLKYPGRMALTSAVSFVSAGVGLTLLSFRRHALAVFALLQTLPLSFGLTSTIGYVAGITFVLPFNLGSQMAVHTAIAFSAYGGVMLGYAWKQAPSTNEGLPKWAPHVATLMLPVLFLGVGITAQQNSALDFAVPLFIGLLAAAFFGAAAYKLVHAPINQKGLILISVPLVFVLIFIVFVTQMSRKSEQAQASYLHSREVLGETEMILRNLVDAEASTRGYVIAGNPAFAEPFHQAKQGVSDATVRLLNLIKHDPAQEAMAHELGTKAAERIIALENIEELIRAGDRTEAIERVQSGEGLRLMNEFRQIREKFLKEQQRLDKNRQAAIQSAWQRFNWLLVAGGSMAIFLAVMLAILFSGGISKRIVTLTENAEALAAGKPLTNSPMKGSDELAHLDHVFRDMAKALLEAARKERAIFENALDIICSTDAEGRFLKMSPSSLRIWGYRPEEMIGRMFTEFLVPDEVEKSVEASQEVRSRKTLTDFENRYRCKNGSIVHMLWSAWWSDADQVVFAMARDITERKKAEEKRDRFFTLSLDMLCIAGTDGYFKRLNPAFQQTLGYRTEELKARPFIDFVHPDDRVATLAEVEKLTHGEPAIQFENRYQCKNGSWKWLSWKTQPFPSEGLLYATARDITERKRMEAALQKAHDNLEKGVEQRTAELLNANELLRHQIAERERAQSDLAEQRSFLRQVIDLNPSFIFAKDREGRFILVNESLASAYGTTPDNVIGKTDADFNPNKAQVESFHRDDLVVIESGRQKFIPEETITDASGKVRWLQTVKRPLKGEDGRVNQLLGVATDITERRKAEQALRESEERTRLVIDTALDAVITMNAEGQINSWNAQAERIFGWPRGEVIGAALAETIIPPRYREAHSQGMRRFLSTGQARVLNKRIEISAINRDGQEFPVELSIAPVQRDGRYYFSAFVRDITDRKRAEEEIKSLNEGLERRVQERTAQLEAANKELEAFSYSVSHDLRAPLRAIDGFSRILLEDYADKLDDDGNRVLEVVRNNARNMGQLIDDLLAFSRLGRKAVEPSPIDMTDLARSVVDEISGLDSEQRPHFTIASIPPAYGDRALLRQVFVNLLSNAMKYSRTKEQPVIEVGGATRNGANIYYVKDNGAGFDMNYANKLFGVFQRLHGPEEFEGTGVGLAIVQRIIHRHGGEVWGEGKVNKGATFYFTLPKESDSNGKRTELE